MDTVQCRSCIPEEIYTVCMDGEFIASILLSALCLYTVSVFNQSVPQSVSILWRCHSSLFISY